MDRAVEDLLEAGLAPSSSEHASELIERIEKVGRRIDAARVEALSEIERTGVYRDDGHASGKVMVRHQGALSAVEANRRASTRRALESMSEVREQWRRGEIGTCQVRRLARAHANPRVRQQLVACQKLMLEWSADNDYKEFDALVTDWVRFVDEDGTRDRNQTSHENRRASVRQEFDGSFSFDGSCASLQGAMMKEIFDRFCDAEFAADWEAATAELGEGVGVGDLSRSDAQRRMDALYAIFCQAAATAPGATAPRTVLNIVMDWDTYQRELCRIEGSHPARRQPDDGFERFRCSTFDGVPIEPAEAAAGSLVGHVRRTVVGADSVVVDKGRSQRLFTGSAAVAARIAATHCCWSGCWVPNRHCQIDHLQPYHPRGPSEPPGTTDQHNAGLFCGRHNRLKHRAGYHVWRDSGGDWHIQRPDGTCLG